jgi:hypothetical protein
MEVTVKNILLIHTIHSIIEIKKIGRSFHLILLFDFRQSLF